MTIHSQSKAISQPPAVAQASVLRPKFSVVEAAAYLRCSKSFLDKRRLDGNGPAYLKLGRRVVYDIVDLETWAAGNKRQHTAERKGYC